MRGILVPQDPSDGNALNLLERITEEKSKLIFKKKQSKRRNKSFNNNSNKATTKLPKQWEWCLLEDISMIIRGITFPASEKSKISENGRIVCLRTSNVQEEIEWDDLLYIKEQFVKREDQIVEKNDIIMSMANSRELVGKVSLVKSKPTHRTTFGGFLGVIRPILLDSHYLTIVLRSSTIKNKLIEKASQTTNIANISLSKLNSLFLPIPPLAEQRRIVAKVDELMELCQQLKTSIISAKTTQINLAEHLVEKTLS